MHIKELVEMYCDSPYSREVLLVWELILILNANLFSRFKIRDSRLGYHPKHIFDFEQVEQTVPHAGFDALIIVPCFDMIQTDSYGG